MRVGVAPRGGPEPPTIRLTAERSTSWATEEYSSILSIAFPAVLEGDRWCKFAIHLPGDVP